MSCCWKHTLIGLRYTSQSVSPNARFLSILSPCCCMPFWFIISNWSRVFHSTPPLHFTSPFLSWWTDVVSNLYHHKQRMMDSFAYTPSWWPVCELFWGKWNGLVVYWIHVLNFTRSFSKIATQVYTPPSTVNEGCFPHLLTNVYYMTF